MGSEELRSAVLNNLVNITQNTTNIGLLNLHLIQSGVILPSDKELIESYSTQDEQVSGLMLLLIKKGPGTKEKVIEALRQTCNGHIADILDTNNNESQKEEFAQKVTLELSDNIKEEMFNPLLNKVQKMVIQELEKRIDDIIAASNTKNISVTEEQSQDGTKIVKVSAEDAPREQQQAKLYAIKKIVLIGDGAVGKTCMIHVWTTGSFPNEYVPTVFDNHQTILKVDENLMQLAIWDTAGQEDYSRLRPLSYPRTDICIIVYKVSNRSSFLNIEKNWAPEIRHFCGKKIPIFVVGNGIDLRNDPATIERLERYKLPVVTLEEGKELAEKVGARGYFECSALTKEGMKDILPSILRIINDLETKKLLGKKSGCCPVS